MTSVAGFKLLRPESARVKTETTALAEESLYESCIGREGERTWSGNFHHNGRTAFQVRRCTGHEGGMVKRRCNLPNNTD